MDSAIEVFTTRRNAYFINFGNDWQSAFFATLNMKSNPSADNV
jgi:hypothetical protein